MFQATLELLDLHWCLISRVSSRDPKAPATTEELDV